MSIQVVSSGEGLTTKGDLDRQALEIAQKQRKTEVTFKNRFGREVIVTEYHAKKMERRGEGKIVSEGRPIQKKSTRVQKEVVVPVVEKEAVVPEQTELKVLQAKFEEAQGRPVPNNKKNDVEWIKETIGE